jgi:hypothetical protein
VPSFTIIDFTICRGRTPRSAAASASDDALPCARTS